MGRIRTKPELMGRFGIVVAILVGVALTATLSTIGGPGFASGAAVSQCSPPSGPVAGQSPPCTTDTANFNAVIQVDPSAAYAGDPVHIDSSQLQGSCASVTYETLQGGSPASPRVSPNNITVILDNDGNVTVVVNGVDCAPGTDLVEADMTVAPFLTATTTVVVDPPRVTPPGVTGYPANEVETGDSQASGDSDVYTVFYVETDPAYAEQTVEISSPQLTGRCLRGSRWESNAAGSPFLNSPTATATIDDDGNAVFVFKGESCAAGDSTVIADVLAGTHPTYTSTYTILPPAGTLAGLRVVGAKKHGGHHGSKGTTTPPTPPAMAVTVSPSPLILVGGGH
jgi:hypothetical protein